MDGGGKGAGFRQGPASAGTSSLLLPIREEVLPWFSTQTLPQARGSGLGGDDGDTSCSGVSTSPGALGVSVGLHREFEWGKKKL